MTKLMKIENKLTKGIPVLITDKTVEDASPEDYKYRLEELRALVGGFINIIPIYGNFVAVVNTDADNLGLYVNTLASSYTGKVLKGNVVICKKDIVI